MEKLRIALLSPLTREASFDSRGSRPRIIYDLAKGLTEKGHEVTTFGPGGSVVPGNFVEISPKSIYKMPSLENAFYQHVIFLVKMMEMVKNRSKDFDIIHSHLYPEILPMLVSDQFSSPLLTTFHLYMWPELKNAFSMYPKLPIVAVSEFQKKEGTSNFIDVVYNGIDVSEYSFNDKPENYFLFFGRMKNGDPKGVTSAIKAAQKGQFNLKIAGNVENIEFFEKEIKPHLDSKIQFIGPIDSFGPIGFKEKVELYKNAKGFLFPIHFKEAFGMTMLEAMACGTPVIAYNVAAVNEVVVEGKTGYIVEKDNIDGIVEATRKIDSINRLDCLNRAKDFSINRMIGGYERVYKNILEKF